MDAAAANCRERFKGARRVAARESYAPGNPRLAGASTESVCLERELHIMPGLIKRTMKAIIPALPRASKTDISWRTSSRFKLSPAPNIQNIRKNDKYPVDLTELFFI
jgi:hypothetical protein